MKVDDADFVPGEYGLVSRRDFLKFCTLVAASLGLPLGMGARIAEAVAAVKRPPVIWLSGQECTGCTETLLRSTHPTVEHLILNLISLDYHETLSTPSGTLAEEAKQKSISANKGKFILVTEGAIPTKDGGIYCMVGGRPVMEILKETAPQAAAIVAIGSCASWGALPSASPNPTGAKSTQEVLGDKFKVINIPGCPPNPNNFLSTVLYILTFKKLPDLDGQGRPRFAYRRLIHEGCERRPHFDAGRFALAFDDEGHRRGWCLYKLGCKGPQTYNNCPAILFGGVGGRSWPVGTGSPCFGCSEKGVGFAAPIVAQASLEHFTPAGAPYKTEEGGKVRVGGGELRLCSPTTYAPIEATAGHGVSTAAVGVLAGLAGVALGAGVTNYLSVPDMPMDTKGAKFNLPGGYIEKADLKTFKPINDFNSEMFRFGVKESIKHSWYNGDWAQHPFDEETVPKYAKFQDKGKYSWVKAPSFNDKPAQVGPLANVLCMYAAGHGPTKKYVEAVLATVSSLAKAKVGPEALHSTIGRHAARAIRTAVLYDELNVQWQALMDNIAKGDTKTWNKFSFPPGEIRGFGFHEAPRGTLSHWVVIDSGKIKNYQCVVPSTWNAGPRNQNDAMGPYEAALMGNPVADPNRPLEVVRTIHSFDPCLACAIHLVDAKGEPITKVSAL